MPNPAPTPDTVATSELVQRATDALNDVFWHPRSSTVGSDWVRAKLQSVADVLDTLRSRMSEIEDRAQWLPMSSEKAESTTLWVVYVEQGAYENFWREVKAVFSTREGADSYAERMNTWAETRQKRLHRSSDEVPHFEASGDDSWVLDAGETYE